MNKRSFLLFLTSVFLFTALSACNAQPGADRADTDLAADFTVETLGGKSFSISEARGKVIILNFWATWCPPCRTEIPHLEEVYQAYEDEGVVVAGASVDKISASELEQFVRANGMSYPVFLATEDVLAGYGPIRSIPTTFIIDRSGAVVERVVGFRDEDFFESRIEKLL